MRGHILQALLVVAIIGASFQPRVGASSPARSGFTVRDSIEISRFSDVDAQNDTASYSPDGRYAAVIVSHGNIASDTVESQIVLFLTAAIRRYLQAGGKAPQPQVLTSMRSVPQLPSEDFAGYVPVIFGIDWLRDSSGIVFSAENNGRRRLYQVDIASRKRHPISPPTYDASEFAESHDGAIVYQAIAPFAPTPAGERINTDAFDMTGKYWNDVLFPSNNAFSATQYVYSDLWKFANGKSTRLTGAGTRHPLLLQSNDERGNIFSVSPDRRSVIISALVRPIPQTWTSYITFEEAGRIDPHHDTKQYNPFAVQRYTLVDLTTGNTTPLIDAPDALTITFINNYFNTPVWSPSGEKVLLPGVFFPLAHASASEQAQLRYPCEAAIVTISTKARSCVLWNTGDYVDGTKANANQSKVMWAAFDNDDTTVSLGIYNYLTTKTVENRYHFENGAWQLILSKPASVNRPETVSVRRQFSIRVKQDLNTPPALWVSTMRGGTERKLWDPNPQLLTMHLPPAVVIHWKDANGNDWEGGLVKPPDYIAGKRYPLVIQTHGFSPDGFMADGFGPTADAAMPLANAGIMVLQIGTTRPEDFNTIREAPDQVEGFRSAIAYLDGQGLVDPAKVGAIGFSRTCYHVESALIAYPHLFAAASLNDGVDESYMQHMFFDIDVPKEQWEGLKIYGTVPWGTGLSTWVKEAPGFNLDRVQSPVLISAIKPSSIFQEWEIYASLRMQHKPVDLMYFPHGHHMLHKPLERLASQQGNVDWFRFWLQGYEDPDPAKAAQYARWRTLSALH